MDAPAMLTTLIRRTGFTEGHARLLHQLESCMAPMASETALAFYDYLGRDPEMREILWEVPGRVERLYESFANWYRELFSGRYDDLYAERRAQIGLVHAVVGIKPAHTLPAMGIVQELSLEHMRNSLRGPNIFGAVEAFQKIIAIESALMHESYMAALEVGQKLGPAVPQDQAAITGARALLGQK